MKHPKLTARQIRDFLPRIPFNTLLGAKLTRLHRDGVTIECEMRHELTNSAGVAHGGVAAAMADACFASVQPCVSEVSTSPMRTATPLVPLS